MRSPDELREGSAVSGNSIQSIEPDVSVIEGDAVTLSCSYSTSYSGVSLHWYRQNPGQAPQYVLQRGAKGSTISDRADFARKRFISETNATATVLIITGLELADEAVYYCALNETQ
ncbi:ribonuclease-like [Platysternon megacephalum]|uniref:Ribonuclease-like n=1 Tax=Platysternon megacephalum TaxID=55544 RepID=A0A4D9DSB8_9SAUR|nr:ribonuclease-like [Platysternon megacephalum]